VVRPVGLGLAHGADPEPALPVGAAVVRAGLAQVGLERRDPAVLPGRGMEEAQPGLGGDQQTAVGQDRRGAGLFGEAPAFSSPSVPRACRRRPSMSNQNSRSCAQIGPSPSAQRVSENTSTAIAIPLSPQLRSDAGRRQGGGFQTRRIGPA
jgi:hypothetical protein